MSYTCYLGGMAVPVPAKLDVKIKGKNKTLILLNEGEINLLRAPGLTEIALPLVFPMLGAAVPPDAYLGMLEDLKAGRKTTQFILVRCTPDGKKLYDTNLTVSVEDYTITEDAKNGLDVAVDVSLKQWRDYGTKTVRTGSDGKAVSVEQERASTTAPSAKSYTVQKGDTLWAIAAKFYGKGSEYGKIAAANADQISDPNRIYPGQVLTLP